MTTEASDGTRASAPERELLAALRGTASTAGIFCDFDGSLAPIVADPAAAREVDGARDALAALAQRFKVVAVASGRPAAFLAGRFGDLAGVRLFGLYGIEEARADGIAVDARAAAAGDAVERAAALLERRFLPYAGVHVERKGLAVAVHFRRATDPEDAMKAGEPLVLTVAAETGLEKLTRGRLVFELGPKVNVDKGEILRRIAREEGLNAALVAGDDRGDLALFEAAAELPLPIRVAVASLEGPPQLVAGADIVVPGPRELVRLLRQLAA